MESMEAFPDGEWESFRRMFSTEEADFGAQFLGHSHFPNGNDHGLSFGTPFSFWPTHEANSDVARLDESLFFLSHATNSDLNYFSQECSYNSGCGTSVLLPNSSYENYYFNDSNHNLITNTTTSTAMDICMADEKDTRSFVPVLPDSASEETVFVREDMSNGELGNLDNGQLAGIAVPANELQLKRKSDMPELLRGGGEEKINSDLSETPKKKARVSRDVYGSKKNVQSRKGLKPNPSGNNEEDTNAGSDGQSSSGCSSEGDSNASQELNGGATSESQGPAALNLNGKTRASRGSATDPQSLYARKRRERINERLRILQNLVPNGTKVDISTMLEEAVQYVKFLQLQIKLLSSDDLWMYAPIAYNGIDIDLQNLHQKIPSLR